MSNTEELLTSDDPPSYEHLVSYYMAEVRELARVTAHPDFGSLFERFLNYPVFLRTRAKQRSPLLPLLNASGDTRIIDMETTSPWVWDALSTAHFAACCDLFAGSILTREQFTPESLPAMAQAILKRYQGADPAQLQDVIGKLHTMDAVRTMQLLRVLGLITRSTTGFRQLGLGAGSGIKDQYSLHLMPGLTRQETSIETGYRFGVEQEYVEHVVVADSNPLHRTRYESLSQDSTPPALGLNKDALEALEDLAQGIERGTLAYRNLVTVIRFEHRMIPDTALFLKRLAGTIEKSADLIITMGAGHTEEDFEGRAAKLAEIFDTLSQVSLRPVLIKLHSPGNTTFERQASLRFGTSSTSTYQVLYCRLERKALQRCA